MTSSVESPAANGRAFMWYPEENAFARMLKHKKSREKEI